MKNFHAPKNMLLPFTLLPLYSHWWRSLECNHVTFLTCSFHPFEPVVSPLFFLFFSRAQVTYAHYIRASCALFASHTCHIKLFFFFALLRCSKHTRREEEERSERWRMRRMKRVCFYTEGDDNDDIECHRMNIFCSFLSSHSAVRESITIRHSIEFEWRFSLQRETTLERRVSLQRERESALFSFSSLRWYSLTHSLCDYVNV